ncbi:hypothetical protein PG988_013009 [Apiospora saccharicola]
MASDSNYGSKHGVNAAAGAHAPVPTTMAGGNTMTGAATYLSGQASAVPTNENGVQPIASGSDANMRAVMNSFNGLSVNGGPVPIFDANAAAAAMPMYFSGGFPAAAGLPVGPGQMSMTEPPYYLHGGYAWPAANQWAMPGMKEHDLRLFNQTPIDYSGRFGTYKAAQPSAAEHQVAHQQDVPLWTIVDPRTRLLSLPRPLPSLAALLHAMPQLVSPCLTDQRIPPPHPSKSPRLA